MTKPTTGKNRRLLDEIADEIHEYKRIDLFVVGDLLLEAKAACEDSFGYGHWGDWLADNFDWSQDTAENYINVARLVARFPKPLRNLRLANTTFYALGREDEDLLPTIIDALAKRATDVQLKPADAADVIRLVRLRHEHGDLPDATLRALDMYCTPPSEATRVIAAALKKIRPVSREIAEKIVAEISAQVVAAAGIGAAPQPQRSRPQTPSVEPPDDASGEEPEPPSAPPPEAELLEALRTLLRHAQRRPLPTIVGGGITGTDLGEILQFIGAISRAMRKGIEAKIVADRAEARSRKTASAQ